MQTRFFRRESASTCTRYEYKVGKSYKALGILYRFVGYYLYSYRVPRY